MKTLKRLKRITALYHGGKRQSEVVLLLLVVRRKRSVVVALAGSDQLKAERQMALFGRGRSIVGNIRKEFEQMKTICK